ncbi:MAG TPA: hypothetical protein VFU15_14310, partial [Bacteroidia bacterium]|nr:hypothetical protein [Bacteroidia bacterium]
DLSNTSVDFPLQLFYQTPFANYAAYDNSASETASATIYNSIAGPSTGAEGVLLFPSFAYSGALYIELSALAAGNTINLYFEQSRGNAVSTSTPVFSYFYLNASGWNELLPISDGTSGFNCSGILQLNIPADIVTGSPVVPGSNCWLLITTNADLPSFAQTVLLSANGVLLQRTGDTYQSDVTAPTLAAGSITKPQTAIPSISTITQPFDSFGGTQAEDETTMNLRVSNRLKTKDRAVTYGDFYTLISQSFPGVYYSSSKYDGESGTVNVYLVKKSSSASVANAFSPLVSDCTETQVEAFLAQRVSLFTSLIVSNYAIQPLSVTANVSIEQGYAWQYVLGAITTAIDLFLSPWIECDATQADIGKAILPGEISSLLLSIGGVESVTGVTFSSVSGSAGPGGSVVPLAGSILVTTRKHTINLVTTNG